jgi:hypothetical protein
VGREEGKGMVDGGKLLAEGKIIKLIEVLS